MLIYANIKHLALIIEIIFIVSGIYVFFFHWKHCEIVLKTSYICKNKVRKIIVYEDKFWIISDSLFSYTNNFHIYSLFKFSFFCKYNSLFSYKSDIFAATWIKNFNNLKWKNNNKKFKKAYIWMTE